MNERKLAFVYGSLLKGFGNHRVIADAKFLGEHITDEKYTLVNLGAFPGVVEKGETAIIGEVYEVTDDIFASLDRLEGYPSFYGRNQIDTAYGKAWIYLLPKSYLSYSKVFSGNWRTK